MTFFLNLGDLLNVSLGDGQGLGTILDDEPRVKIEVSDGIAGEGTSNGQFKITKTGSIYSPTGQIQVFYQVAGTATHGQDYTGLAGWVMLPATGYAEAYVNINVTNDSLWEEAESVELTLQPSSSYAVDLNHSSAAFDIADNDHWSVGIVTLDTHAYEVGQDPGKFRFTRSGESDLSQSLTVYVQLTGSTATLNTDYSLSPSYMGQIVIPAGESVLDVVVTPVSDSQPESPSETVKLSITPNSNYYEVLTGFEFGIVTIHDGTANQPPTLNSLSDLTIAEDAASPPIALSGITAGTGETQDLTVTASTSDQNLITNLTVSYVSAATTGQVTFTPGADRNGSATITVTVEDSLGGTVTQSMTVTVTPVNDPPRIPAHDPVEGREDTLLPISLPGDSGPYESDPIIFVILSLPEHGTLLKTGGVAVAVGETLASNQVDYDPNDNFNGLDVFQYRVVETASGLSAIGYLHLKILAVDDAPEIQAPVQVQLDANGHFSFSAETLAVSDIDIYEGEPATVGNVRVKLTGVHGTISLSPTQADLVGIDFLSDPHVGVTRITIQGRLTAVNGLLAKLTFDRDAGYAGDDARLLVDANDLGSTGLDGPKSDDQTIKLVSDPVNNPPINQLPPGPLFVRPCDHDVPIPLSVTDADAGDEHVHVDVGVYGSGTITLGRITGDYVWLEGPLAYVNQRLAQLIYHPPANAALPQTSQVFIYTTDMGHSGTGGAKDDYDELTIKLNNEPTVRIVATDPDAYERGLDHGKFTVYRGTCTSSPNDFAQPLTVTYTVDLAIPNAATPGADYQPLTETVTIEAGELSADIDVAPFADQITEPDEYVKVDLVGNPPSSNPLYGTPGDPGGYGNYYYVDPSASTATVTIHDYPVTIHPNPIAFSATDAYASEEKAPGNLNDDGEITFTRGEQNIALNQTIFFKITGGTAVLNQDFTVLGASQNSTNNEVWEVIIPAGKSSAVVKFIPIDESEIEWDETIQIVPETTNPNTNQAVDYEIVASSNSEVTLFDNDGFGGLLNRNVDSGSTGLSADSVGYGMVSLDVYQGQVAFGVALPGASGPVYNSDDNLHPLLPVQWQLPSGTSPGSISATTMFAGIPGPSVTFDVTSAVTAATPLRYVLPTSDSISSQIATGHYDYNFRFQVDDHVRTIRGSTEIINAVDSKFGGAELGTGWRLGELDRLLPNDGNTAQFTDQGLAAIGGQAVVRGDNTSGFFSSKITEKTVNSNPEFGDPNLWLDGTYQSSSPYKYTLSGDKAKWTFDNLEENQQYQLFATWVPGLTRATQANYKVVGKPFGSTASSKTTTVNQRFTPGEVLEDGQQWRSLGYYTTGKDKKFVVFLQGSGGETVAQSVMLVKAWQFDQPPLGSFSQLVYEDSPAASAKRFILRDKFGGQAEFDEQGLLTLRQDRNHNQTEYAYVDGDHDGLKDDLETITRQGNLKTNLAYASGFLTTITDFAGRVTTYDIDTAGHTNSVTLPDPGPDDAPPQWEFTYGGPDGQLDSLEDPRENTTKIDYTHHRVSSVHNPDTYSWSVAPFLLDGIAGANENSPGNAPIRKPATGLIGQNEADAQLPAGSLKEPRATYTDPRTNKWVYQTDAYGLTTALAKPKTQAILTEDVWQWERRPDGLATKYSQPKGGGGNFTLNYRLDTLYDQYDSKGNLLHVENADGTTSSWQYNTQFSAATKFTDQLNRDTVYELDSSGNVEYMKTMDGTAAARTLRTQYTAQPTDIFSLPGGLPTEVTVAHGTNDAVTTKNDYFTSGSKVGLVQKETYALSTTIATSVVYDYDSRRNRTSTKNALQPATASLYDDLNRLAKVTYPAPSAGEAVPYATFKYDAMGNIRESQDVRGVVTKSKYDAMNRLEYVEAPKNGGSSESDQSVQTTQNFYDESGHIVKVKYPKQTGNTGDREAVFDYDARNQHVKTTLSAPGVTPPAGMTELLADAPVTNYSYDAIGNLKSLSDPRNAEWTTTYDYDDLNRRFHVVEPATEDHGATNYYSLFDDAGRLTSSVSPGPSGSALTTTYAYDRFDRVVLVTPPADANGLQASTTTTYDLRNNVVSVTVAGHTTETTYDKRDRVTDVKSPDPDNGHGRIIQHREYSPISEVIYSSTYEEGHAEKTIASTFVYDNLSRLISTTGTDPDGTGPSKALTTTYKYDAGGNVLRTVVSGDGALRQTDTEYDNYNRPWRVQGVAVNGVRPETISLFDAAGQNVEVREKTSQTIAGSTWRTVNYVFDNIGRLFKTTGPADELGNRPTTYTVADEAGNVRGVMDALGHITERVYNSLGELWKVIEPATAEEPTVHPTTTYGYNLAGLVATVSDSLPRVTTNVYDNIGNLLETALPAVGGVIPHLYYAYDVLGNLKQSTDVEGNTTGYLRDGLGRVTTTTLPERSGSTGPAPTIVNVYDGLGNLATQTNELTQTTSYEHDLFGRTTKVMLPDPDGGGPLASSFVASTHDSFGNVLTQTNAENETTTYGYNDRGERTSVTDPRGYTTLLGYDLLGRNYRVEDPNHNVTRFGFDDLDQTISVTQDFAGGGSSTRGYRYDLAGRQTRVVDRRGRVTVYGYDERDQMREETWYNNVADADNQANSTGGIGYAYDVVGRMTGAGMTSFGYDSLDRITTQSFGHVLGFATLTTTYGNRQDGLRDTLALTIGGAADFLNDYDYDERLWLKSVTQTDQAPVAGQPTPHAVATKRVVFQHGDDGRLEHLLRYANTAETQFVAQTDFAYDDGNRLRGIHHFKPALPTNTTLAQYTWTYDGADRIENLTGPDGSVTYAYDDRGQLTGADYTGASQPADAVYVYDANGNREGEGVVVTGHNLVQTDGTYGYIYDEEGNRTHRTNLTTGEVDEYTWDNRNRLTAVTHRDLAANELWRVEYQYDYANRLIVRTETFVGLPPTVERFVYDGNQIVLATNGAGQVTHRYLWGESVDQILADESVDLVSGIGTTRWTLTDHLNTVRDLANYNSTTDTTSIVDHIIYDAFGKVTSESSSANSSSLKFTGHFTDPQTGLQWNLNRWYDSGLHQWLSVDPILFEAGDPNPRRYVSNDPVSRVDPTGLAFTDFGDMANPPMKLTPEQAKRLKISKAVWNNLGVTTVLHNFYKRTISPPSDETIARRWDKSDINKALWKEKYDLELAAQRAVTKGDPNAISSLNARMDEFNERSQAAFDTFVESQVGPGRERLKKHEEGLIAMSFMPIPTPIGVLASVEVQAAARLEVASMATLDAKMLASSKLSVAGEPIMVANAAKEGVSLAPTLRASSLSKYNLPATDAGLFELGNEGAFLPIQSNGRRLIIVESRAPLYEVGLAKELTDNFFHGVRTGTIAEHVPQTKWAGQLIPTHSRVNKVAWEPAIRVTEKEADAITRAETLTQVPGSARDALAIKIRLLREHTEAPNSALKAVIRLNREGNHKWDYLPLHRLDELP